MSITFLKSCLGGFGVTHQIFPQQPFRKVIHVHHPTSGGKRIKNNSVYILGLYKKIRSFLGRFFFLGGVQADSSTQEHQIGLC